MSAFYFTSYLITAGEDSFCTEGNELHFKWNLTRTELSTFSSKSVECALKKNLYPNFLGIIRSEKSSYVILV